MLVLAQATTEPQVIEWIGKLGAGGLAFIVLALMMGWLVTRREYDSAVNRAVAAEQERNRWIDLYLRRDGLVANAVDLAKQQRRGG